MHLKAGQRLEAEHGAEAFEVVELLGEGRTGEVYDVRLALGPGMRSEFQSRLSAMKGEEAEGFALKLARASGGEPLSECNTRLLRALAALERVVHPGIVHAGALGWHRGRAFFVMEQLEGPSLAERWSGRTQVSYREGMQVLLQLSEALAQCHEAGVIHRDVRPSNVILESGRGPVLLGFEWCALSPGEACPALGVGAAEYAPPEYLTHVLDPAALYVSTPRADVFALAVMGYAFLAGQMPVRREGKDLNGYLRALRDAMPASPVAVNPQAPPACAALVMRLLDRDGPVDARLVPGLLREAMVEDGAALSRSARPCQASAETLLSSIRVPPRRPVGARRALPELWAAGRGLLGRNGLQLAVVSALVACGAVLRGNEHAETSRLLAGSNSHLAESNAHLAESNAHLAESNHHEAETNASLSRALERLTGQLVEGLIHPSAAPLASLLTGGMKMPEKPEPQWLRPGPDGKCRDPKTGDRLGGSGVLRGTCWLASAKINPKDPCPEWLYDVPPEAASEPLLKRSCLEPIEIPRKPQAVTPRHALSRSPASLEVVAAERVPSLNVETGER